MSDKPLFRRASSSCLGLLAGLLLGCPSTAADLPADAGAGAADAPGPDLARPSDRACNPTDPRQPPATVAALPDAGEAPYVAVLEKARRTIRVFSYLMGDGKVLETLLSKARADVDVRVILDQGQPANKGYATTLQAAGAKILWSDPRFSYMHAKSIIADEAEAVVSTGNFSAYYNERERNFAVTLTDPLDIADLVGLFEADWARRDPSLSCTRLLVSPINSKDRLVALINSAQKSLRIESMQFAELGVRDAVAARKAAGVEVRVLLADPSWVDANAAAATFLSAQGIPARWMAKPDVHVKAIVADGEDGGRAYAGSENLSYTSLTKNREIGVILTEPQAVKTIQDTFERDWAGATPF